MAPKDLTNVLRGAPPGQWIALSRDHARIVGAGYTVEEVLKQAREQGETEPIITKSIDAGIAV